MTPPDDLSHLTEEEAALLWQRAAHLQAEAARHAEQASDEGDDASEPLDPRDTGYALEHVRTAGLEAGISAEYLDLALSELRADREIVRPGGGAAVARHFLKDPPDSVSVRRVIDASPADVLRGMEEVFPREPYTLSLTDRRGDPTNGGLLVFAIEGAGYFATEGFQGKVSAADLRQVLASVRPLDAEGTRAELTLRAPVAWAHGINAGIGAGMVVFGTAMGFGVGSAMGGAAAMALLTAGVVAAPMAGAVAAAVTVAGTAGFSFGSLRGFRWLYHISLEKGRQGLDTLCSAVAVEAQGGWKLTPEPGATPE